MSRRSRRRNRSGNKPKPQRFRKPSRPQARAVDQTVWVTGIDKLVARSERKEKKEAREAGQDYVHAEDHFIAVFEQGYENLTDEQKSWVLGLIEARDSMVLARARMERAETEKMRAEIGSEVDPRDTQEDFLMLGARLYRAMSVGATEAGNADLLAACLESVDPIWMRSWELTAEKLVTAHE